MHCSGFVTSIDFATLFCSLGFALAKFWLLPIEVADFEKGGRERYKKIWVAESQENGNWNIIGSVALKKTNNERILELKVTCHLTFCPQISRSTNELAFQ